MRKHPIFICVMVSVAISMACNIASTMTLVATLNSFDTYFRLKNEREIETANAAREQLIETAETEPKFELYNCGGSEVLHTMIKKYAEQNGFGIARCTYVYQSDDNEYMPEYCYYVIYDENRRCRYKFYESNAGVQAEKCCDNDTEHWF